MTTPADQAVEAAEREKFEAWFEEAYWPGEDEINRKAGFKDPSWRKQIGDAWAVWMARANLPRPLEVAAPVGELAPVPYEKHEKEVLEVIQQRDHRDEIIDALCDAVLGPDRDEWSSAYYFEDAVVEVQERIQELTERYQCRELNADAASRSPVAAEQGLGEVPPEEQECGANGSQGCSYRPDGPRGELMCQFFGATPSGGAGCSVNAGGEKGSSHLAGGAGGGEHGSSPTDAERYQWLREHCDSMSLNPPLTVAKVTGWGLEGWSGDDLNSVIDTAILASNPPAPAVDGKETACPPQT